jgi:sialic acid synthase SpsE
VEADPTAITVSIGDRVVGGDARAFVIAEAGSNHNGVLSLARELVKKAAEAGADAVKFQLFRADSVYPPNVGVVDMPGGPADIHDVFEQFALRAEWLHDLAALASDEGLVFLCTPFDEETLAAVAALQPAAVKIASPELNHLPLLRGAAQLNRPLICSTGLCTLADIEEAVSTIFGVWSEPEIVILQCVSSYPAPAEESNLRVIDTLRRAFGLPVGLSDHTIDPERTPAIARAVGACVIEKHLTFDRTSPGPDHPFSLEPQELRSLVDVLHQLDDLESSERMRWVRRTYGDHVVERILGDGRKTIQPSERPLYPADKRSIHAIRDIPAGHTLSAENVRVLRSERNLSVGLHPRYWETICGAITSSAISCGEGLTWSHLIQQATVE